MDIPQAGFLTTAEFHRGPDLLQPGSLTGRRVDPAAVAFIFTLHPYAGKEPDIRVSPEDRRLIFWPAGMGHEQVAGREPVLRAMFGPAFREATKAAAYEHGSQVAYDPVELRRLANQGNLFGRYGRVRGVPCLMLWNRCEGWEPLAERLLVLLDVPGDGLLTQGHTDQWWVRQWRGRATGG